MKKLRHLAGVATTAKRMKQRGYFDFNVTGFFITCLVVGIAIGVAIRLSRAVALVVRKAADSRPHRIGATHE